MSTTAGGKKGRKIGRNGALCKIYRDRDTRMRNKVRKVARHLKNFPDDLQAQAWTRA